MDDVIAGSTARGEFNMLLLTIFGASALLLASIGMYGLMSYSVEQRRREIGIRLALGAALSDVRSMILFQGMKLALIGVAIGIFAAVLLSRFLASFLFGVEKWDPIVFVTIPTLLTLVALLALWLPASRATLVDPVEALRPRMILRHWLLFSCYCKTREIRRYGNKSKLKATRSTGISQNAGNPSNRVLVIELA